MSARILVKATLLTVVTLVTGLSIGLAVNQLGSDSEQSLSPETVVATADRPGSAITGAPGSGLMLAPAPPQTRRFFEEDDHDDDAHSDDDHDESEWDRGESEHGSDDD